MKCLMRIITVAVLLLTGSLMAVVSADPPGADVVCDGLSGAAFGLCTAAVNVGCGEEGVDNPGCAKIQENFERITGEPAPWTIPYCSDNSECAATEFCKKEDGDCGGSGICAPIPDFCAQVESLVIACNGETYLNSCVAHQARESISCYVSGGFTPPGAPLCGE